MEAIMGIYVSQTSVSKGEQQGPVMFPAKQLDLCLCYSFHILTLREILCFLLLFNFFYLNLQVPNKKMELPATYEHWDLCVYWILSSRGRKYLDTQWNNWIHIIFQDRWVLTNYKALVSVYVKQEALKYAENVSELLSGRSKMCGIERVVLLPSCRLRVSVFANQDSVAGRVENAKSCSGEIQRSNVTVGLYLFRTYERVNLLIQC